jgi:hypothetical protein
MNERFDDFRGGCPWITRHERDAGMARGEGNGFVTAKKQTIG